MLTGMLHDGTAGLEFIKKRKALLTNIAGRGTGIWAVPQQEQLEEIKQHVNRLRKFLLSGATGGLLPDTESSATEA